eukprot:g1851.t1
MASIGHGLLLFLIVIFLTVRIWPLLRIAPSFLLGLTYCNLPRKKEIDQIVDHLKSEYTKAGKRKQKKGATSSSGTTIPSIDSAAFRFTKVTLDLPHLVTVLFYPLYEQLITVSYAIVTYLFLCSYWECVFYRQAVETKMIPMSLFLLVIFPIYSLFIIQSKLTRTDSVDFSLAIVAGVFGTVGSLVILMQASYLFPQLNIEKVVETANLHFASIATILKNASITETPDTLTNTINSASVNVMTPNSGTTNSTMEDLPLSGDHLCLFLALCCGFISFMFCLPAMRFSHVYTELLTKDGKISNAMKEKLRIDFFLPMILAIAYIRPLLFDPLHHIVKTTNYTSIQFQVNGILKSVGLETFLGNFAEKLRDQVPEQVSEQFSLVTPVIVTIRNRVWNSFTFERNWDLMLIGFTLYICYSRVSLLRVYVQGFLDQALRLITRAIKSPKLTSDIRHQIISREVREKYSLIAAVSVQYLAPVILILASLLIRINLIDNKSTQGTCPT